MPISMTTTRVTASFAVACLTVLVASRSCAAAEERYCSYQNNIEPSSLSSSTSTEVDDDADDVVETWTGNVSSSSSLAAENVSDSVTLVKRKRKTATTKMTDAGQYLGSVMADNRTMKCEAPGTV